MNKYSIIYIPFFIILIFLSSCGDVSIPKPHGYIRTDYPEKKYQTFDTNYPYKFKYPVYSKIENDSTPNAEKYWANIIFPSFNAKIYISYKKINGNLSNFEEDTRKLAYKHSIKADAINSQVWNNPQKKVYGVLYEIKGDVASQIQFYLTDSTTNFIRAAFYFNAIPNKDSLAPALEFIRKDIDVMIESFEWKNN
jgi:gliding motility-associated lipoprotein GldD